MQVHLLAEKVKIQEILGWLPRAWGIQVIDTMILQGVVV